MSDVLIGQTYFLRFDPKLYQAMQPYPPLGSLYAASYLRAHGYPAALFDAMLAESEDEWAAAIEREKPRFAVLFEDNFNYLSKMCLLRMRQAAWRMIDMARERGCTVIVCGADATDHAADYLACGADFVLLGEGEITLGELLDRLTGKTRQAFSEIAGLAYQESGQPRLNARRPDISDLDALPFPAWDLVDVEHYRSVWLERHGYFSMNMVTTRGCPFHCNWCAKPIWGQRYHSRSPENVAAEMRWLKQTYHPDHLAFVDDIFGLKPGWIARLAARLQAEDAGIPFKCLNRVDLLLRPGEVEALAQAGAQTVWVGAESGSQTVLDAMDKGTRVEQIYQARQLLKDAGIQAGFFLQFGYPGETRDDIERTIRMVRQAAPDDIGISVSYPLPGTRFHAAVRDQLGQQQNWHDSDDLAMLYRGPFSTAFYRQLHRVVHKEFRVRKAWLRMREKAPWRERLTGLARFAWHTVSLPLARWKLDRLASSTSEADALPHLPHEAAASPTPQDRL